MLDINECNDQKSHPCYGVCNNTVGSYTCTCPYGSFGNASYGCVVIPVAAVAEDSKHLSTVFIIGNDTYIQIGHWDIPLSIYTQAYIERYREKYVLVTNWVFL